MGLIHCLLHFFQSFWIRHWMCLHLLAYLLTSFASQSFYTAVGRLAHLRHCVMRYTNLILLLYTTTTRGNRGKASMRGKARQQYCCVLRHLQYAIKTVTEVTLCVLDLYL